MFEKPPFSQIYSQDIYSMKTGQHWIIFPCRSQNHCVCLEAYETIHFYATLHILCLISRIFCLDLILLVKYKDIYRSFLLVMVFEEVKGTAKYVLYTGSLCSSFFSYASV